MCKPSYLCSSPASTPTATSLDTLETCARLLRYASEDINKQSTGLQTAYILVCTEYKKVSTVYDANTPTEHMLLFAKFFQTESASYLLQDNKQTSAYASTCQSICTAYVRTLSGMRRTL